MDTGRSGGRWRFKYLDGGRPSGLSPRFSLAGYVAAPVVTISHRKGVDVAGFTLDYPLRYPLDSSRRVRLAVHRHVPSLREGCKRWDCALRHCGDTYKETRGHTSIE